jgi:adenine-specific DNA-methyltransferase
MKNQNNNNVKDYRYDQAKRKHIPEAGLGEYDKVAEKKIKYKYDPHLDPQLQWSGKDERQEIEVDLVSLHIHERVSTKAIIEGIQKEEPRQLGLFADPQLPLDKRVEFYQHDVDWSNRLILGDSLLVTNSLLHREGMAGKVQMIYMDPPYGIGYNSNFQPKITQRDVKDGDDKSLTREIEQIRAYRDTWKLGIHSYLTYLRDRLLLCRELLHDSGSIFVQMNDENLHFVRNIMDEVFGNKNFVSIISFVKTSGFESKVISRSGDYLIWFAKDIDNVKYRQLFWEKTEETSGYNRIELSDGTRRSLSKVEKENLKLIPHGAKLYSSGALFSPGISKEGSKSFEFDGQVFYPSGGHWKTDFAGLKRLAEANRIEVSGKTLRFIRYLDDFNAIPINNIWKDTQTFTENIFVVQTNAKVIDRCILMTTDPGDLVLDPTCGSGTTAFCAEKWGRRWITCDTSRGALFLARQRLLTATFPYYELAHTELGIKGGLIYETVPHITLESIAKNPDLNPDKIEKIRKEIKSKNPKLKTQELEVEVRKRINEIIRKNASQEVIYDRPNIVRKITRVSGPFTVEAIPVPVAVEPEEALTGMIIPEGKPTDRAGDYLDNMLEYLRKDGITFPGGKKMKIENLQPVKSSSVLHAEGAIKQNGGTKRVVVSFGPPYGPITVKQVEEGISSARWEYDLLVFAGFSFDPEAQAFIQKNPHPKLKLHLAHIRPDVKMGDLLKTTSGSQLFTVFGEPDVAVNKNKDDTYTVELKGVDIYDPMTGEVKSSRAEDVAAWFLDTDYDGYCFHICQAFFPANDKAWDKLQRALKAVINPDAFEQLRGTVSLLFKPGEHSRIAVKVIDVYGNEVIRVINLK